MALPTSVLTIHLTQFCPQCCILNPKLIHESSTFFPSPVSLICGCQRSVQQLAAGFQSFDMSADDLIGAKRKMAKGRTH
jgi:hypothetical protein